MKIFVFHPRGPVRSRGGETYVEWALLADSGRKISHRICKWKYLASRMLIDLQLTPRAPFCKWPDRSY